MASTKKWDDLDITNDEAQRLCNAFKSEEFRKMFMDYAEEIQDPENKKRYEEELVQLEAERGIDAKFIHPEPGYVMKTSVDGNVKAFINICKNEHVGKPEMKKALHPATGKMASSWSLPHSLSPPRDDTDKANSKCRVFDVVFHPDAYRMGESNAAFRRMLNDSALDTIERQFGVKLDRNNIKFPNMKFKGTPQATIMRLKQDKNKADGDNHKTQENSAEGNEVMDDIMKKIPYPYGDKTSDEISSENEKRAKKRDIEQSSKKGTLSEVTVPKHTIVHRHNIDFQDYRDAPDAGPTTRPKELVIHIDLPLLKSASFANLDIFEKRILLQSTTPAKYKLDLHLPYPVDDNRGSAKFDKSKRRLTVTLPVLDLPDSNNPKANGFHENGTHGPNGECDGAVPDLEDDVPELEDDDTEENSSSNKLIQLIPPVIDNEAPAVSNETLTNTDIDEPLPDTKDIWTENDFDFSLLKPKITYRLPEHTANQDKETVTFISMVKHVDKDSLSKTFGDNSVQLKFISVGSGGYPMYYSFMVQLTDCCLIEKTACDVSISEQNVVMIMGKMSESVGIWDKYLVGTDTEHLEEALFVTEKTLSSALDQLDANTMPLNNNDKMPDLEVTDMSDDHLTIQLSNTSSLDPKLVCSKKGSESSDDILVVQSGDQTNLHSILKDRTVSESSDEVFGVRGAYLREDSVSSILSTGSASDGPASENEDANPPHRKKSVSFSEYVDSTTYKANASVSTLHATLKKKSKRYRKKEAKIERRRRQSSGSEHEHSSEEQSSQPDTSEGLDTGEEDDEDVVIDYQVGVELPKEPIADLHDDDDDEVHDVVAVKQPIKKTKKNKNKKKNKKPKSAIEGFSETNAASHTPPETRGDSVTSEEGESGVECVANSEDGKMTNAVTNGECVKVGDGEEDCDSDDTEHAQATKALPTQKDAERTKGVDGAPDTMLSWRDGPTATNQSDVTKCAFNFSNMMMYDLDDD